MRLPTEKEINVHDSPDERIACDHFLNKTLLDAEILLRENSAFYQEDLMWMGPVAFNFYLQAVMNYVKSDYSNNDEHFIYCLYDILKYRSSNNAFTHIKDILKELVAYIVSNYNKFNVDKDIYGDLLGEYVGFIQDLDKL